ncbi:TPA: hypothetical protein NOE63_006649 [Pseudomonas aeruginosa]|uniref:hypothetical protein n=1 Tax=Pseudomonas aeruginosa TaxID=287 RepID=UPI000A810DE7|nr:hypothetical protein [Pseudomonas aeruginosa]MBM2511500.1 hypothetical protein [Pseudomonas aeruginosa]MBM2574428.1 hypothetical protein [Pseudomonas aeruginosa]MBY9229138.1 hypothetical protein [Pseudomonas aeruginosa]MBY9273726.1 hypothetical protein [Pseudomonas aeruginosa]MBY9553369.1 hypothetical protein [Pseudomonas aeruginosa]
MLKWWKNLSLKKRLLVLGGIGFLVGSFVQAEVDRGDAPGPAVLVALVLGCFVAIQGFKDLPADRNRES